MSADILSSNRRALAALVLCLCFLLMPRPAAAVNHVIHVSIDGLRGDTLKSSLNASPQDFPSFKRFVDEGATTFNARPDFTNTVTLPNHTSMLTGRPVDQPQGTPHTTQHGYTTDGVHSPSSTLHNSGNPNLSYVVSTLDVAHDNGLSTAFYASKSKFSLYVTSYDESNGALDVTGPDNGRNKIDSHYVSDHPVTSHVNFLTDMASSEFNYSFLHYRLPDSVGHNSGWESEFWINSIKLIDENMGDLLDLVESNANLANDTVIILTADHGGTGLKHDVSTDPANYTIPLLVWGAGVASGADLYALNPISRVDPGSGRPSYTDAGQPIRNGDSGNLALDLLGLGPIDGSTINANQDLVIASAFAADFDANQSVDGDDLSIWQAGYGMTSEANMANGDANRNGAIEGIDFLIWQQFDGSSLTSTATVIPEASCATLMLLALVASAAWRMPRV